MPRVLPLDYAVRNLARRPLRTLLTAGSCALVAALLASTAAFVQGLSGSAASQGRDDVGILVRGRDLPWARAVEAWLERSGWLELLADVRTTIERGPRQ